MVRSSIGFEVSGILLALLILPNALLAQSGRGTSPDVGIRSNAPSVFALVNAQIVIDAKRSLKLGSLVIQDGKIISVGEHLEPPAGAEIVDCQGDYLYPAFVDALVEFEGQDEPLQAGHWNASITPQRRLDRTIKLDASKLASLRQAGIGIVLAAPVGGIIKGQSCVISTGSGSLETKLLSKQLFQHFRLYPSRGSGGLYPNSPMGAVALVRQTLSDAQWYQSAMQAVEAESALPAPEFNAALEALLPVIGGAQSIIIDGTNELYALRADQLAREFSMKLIVRGSGREYRRLDAIAHTNRTLIVPVNFPDAPKVTTRQQVVDATLEDLMHWRLAPENPAKLQAAGVDFVLTSDGLADLKDFLPKIREAVQRGLEEDAALAALTTKPAQLLKIDDVAGSLERGKFANILRADGPLFNQKTKLKETWVQGQRFRMIEDPDRDLRGVWSMASSAGLVETLELELSGTAASLKAKVGLPGAFEVVHAEVAPTPPVDQAKSEPEVVENAEAKDKDAKPEGAKGESPKVAVATVSNFTSNKYQLSGTFESKEVAHGLEGSAILSAVLLTSGETVELSGTLAWPNGKVDHFSGVRKLVKEDPKAPESAQRNAETAKQDDVKNASELASARAIQCEVNYPLGAYGLALAPERPEWLLIRGATLWTCGVQGILEDSDLLIRQGVIEAVGKNLEAPHGASIVEAKGMHVSPGIIDCHSHIATDGGVNESGQAVTAEVRIGDFIDPNDITIYRQLAGGVTTVNVLHGSANPIGGQNQVIKLRWGSLGEEMKMSEAPAGIKFALGENVKQSNRTDTDRSRYPQTRMGVEQLMRDRFEAAKLYRTRWSQWATHSKGLPPRKDYELEAIAEILEGRRWVHCHSYRQDEILTVLRVLEDYGVTIGSLQHILEGYKVADAMAKHGATGSSFSDWWAYKSEVFDAIPFNGALMHRAGVVVSFNSDDGELARHLNHEAAKAIKYGGVSEQEALKFVTLNPAKQLRIDSWVGSLEPGKQADVVVWNRSPLSTMSVCMQTWVDGRKYFDRTHDLKRRESDEKLRLALVQYVATSGAKTGAKADQDPSYWWARHDEFCHHGHDEETHRSQTSIELSSEQR